MEELDNTENTNLDNTENTDLGAQKINPNILKFKKPFTYNGREYTEIDLSGIENLSASQLKKAEKEFRKEDSVSLVNEMSLGYACIIGRMATGLSKEFFDAMPGKTAIDLRNYVSNFFLSEE